MIPIRGLSMVIPQSENALQIKAKDAPSVFKICEIIELRRLKDYTRCRLIHFEGQGDKTKYTTILEAHTRLAITLSIDLSWLCCLP